MSPLRVQHFGTYCELSRKRLVDKGRRQAAVLYLLAGPGTIKAISP